MKKIGFIVLIIVFVLCVWPEKDDNIRIRVIANSNSEIDQKHKNNVVLIMKKIIFLGNPITKRG